MILTINLLIILNTAKVKSRCFHFTNYAIVSIFQLFTFSGPLKSRIVILQQCHVASTACRVDVWMPVSIVHGGPTHPLPAIRGPQASHPVVALVVNPSRPVNPSSLSSHPYHHCILSFSVHLLKKDSELKFEVYIWPQPRCCPDPHKIWGHQRHLQWSPLKASNRKIRIGSNHRDKSRLQWTLKD